MGVMEKTEITAGIKGEFGYLYKRDDGYTEGLFKLVIPSWPVPVFFAVQEGKVFPIKFK